MTEKNRLSTLADKISFIDFLIILLKNIKTILLVTLISLLIGVFYAIITPRQYVATASFVPDVNDENTNLSSGISALKSFGFDLNTNQGKFLSPAIFPKILKSNQLYHLLLKDSVLIMSTKKSTSFFKYFNSFNKSLWNSLMDTFSSSLVSHASNKMSNILAENIPAQYSPEEAMTMENLTDRNSVEYDMETGIITVSFTDKDPFIASQFIERQLNIFINVYKSMLSRKQEDNLNFLRWKLKQAQEELKNAETDIAEFVDRNLEVRSAKAKLEKERLQRIVDFKTNLYKELLSQYTNVELEFQKSTPVITMVQYPKTPSFPSYPRRKLITIVSAVIGFFISIFLVIVKDLTSKYLNLEENRQKWMAFLSELQKIKTGFFTLINNRIDKK